MQTIGFWWWYNRDFKATKFKLAPSHFYQYQSAWASLINNDILRSWSSTKHISSQFKRLEISVYVDFQNNGNRNQTKAIQTTTKNIFKSYPLTENFYILFVLIFLSYRKIKNSDLVYYMTLIILDQGPIFYLLTTWVGHMQIQPYWKLNTWN